MKTATVLLTLSAAIAGGCTDSSLSIVEVTGQVTLDGRPARAEVIFEPVGKDGIEATGRPSTAFSDSTGQFVAYYTPNRQGAQVGRHRVVVTILADESQAQPPTKQTSSNKGIQTSFLREVRPGNKPFHFALTF